MKIKKVVLNEFKRFQKLTIDLGEDPKRIVALVGPNGCGKSSVLDAFLSYNNAFITLGEGHSRDFRYKSLRQINNYNIFDNILIEFDIGSFRTIYENRRSNGKNNTIFSFRSPYRYNNDLKVQNTVSLAPITKNNYGASYSSDIDSKMEANYRRLYTKFYAYFRTENCTYNEAVAHIIGELNESISRCLDLKISDIGNIEDNRGCLYFTKSDYESTIFEYNLLSSGEKEVVDIILDLYLRSDEYDETIFLIDEPELHINTSIQRKLLIEINRLIGPNCQLWITTHSVGFLRALQEELKNDCQIIEFQPDVPWASSDQVLVPINKTRADWLRIFNTALDDLATLISPKRIIYCEGKDKPGPGHNEKGTDAQVYNNIFGEKYPDTVFVSSGGNTELDQRSEIAISILTKVFPELEILVFKDRDMASGYECNENDRKTYLEQNPENHRVMKRRELENYLFDKEVLKKYCNEKENCHFHEDEYDQIITDICNDDVKQLTNTIKKLCEIRTPINPEIFKIRLSKFITPDMTVYQELEDCIFNRK